MQYIVFNFIQNINTYRRFDSQIFVEVFYGQ